MSTTLEPDQQAFVVKHEELEIDKLFRALVKLEGSDGHVVVSVTDRGIGISREEQRRIFDRFHRVSTGLVHEVRGSGLGLAIVRHIVQAHGGSVRVESEPGKGSTFAIVLPVLGPTVQEDHVEV